MNFYRQLMFSWIIIFLSINIGCSITGQRKTLPQANQTGSVNGAKRQVAQFLSARLKGESEEDIKGYLSERGWQDYQEQKELVLFGTSNPHFTGFKITNTRALKDDQAINERYLIQAAIQGVYYNQPYAENTTEALIVEFNKGQYLIDSANFIKRVVVFESQKSLILRRGDIESVIIKLEELPEEITPQGAEPEIRFGFGKDRFTSIALSPSEKKIAYGTIGVHGGLGWVDLSVKPFRNHILDWIFESAPTLMIFSPDEQYLAVELTSSVGNQVLQIYSVGSGKLLDFKISSRFKVDQYSITLLNWDDGETVTFRVSGQPGENNEDTGNWSLNVVTGEFIKLLK